MLFAVQTYVPILNFLCTNKKTSVMRDQGEGVGAALHDARERARGDDPGLVRDRGHGRLGDKFTSQFKTEFNLIEKARHAQLK